MRTDLCFMPMKKNLSLALCLCINIYTYIYIDIDICYIYIRIYTHLFLDLHTHNSVVVGTHTYLYVSVYMYICMDIVVRCTGPLGCNHIYIYLYRQIVGWHRRHTHRQVYLTCVCICLWPEAFVCEYTSTLKPYLSVYKVHYSMQAFVIKA